MKKIFVPNTNTKTENIGSTRPPTSSSKSFKSVNFSKSDLSTNINKTTTISRPNSSFIKIQENIIDDDYEKAGYLYNVYQKENDICKNQNFLGKKSKIQSAKPDSKYKKSEFEYLNYSDIVCKINKKPSKVFEKYPQFYDALQQGLMKEISHY